MQYTRFGGVVWSTTQWGNYWSFGTPPTWAEFVAFVNNEYENGTPTTGINTPPVVWSSCSKVGRGTLVRSGGAGWSISSASIPNIAGIPGISPFFPHTVHYYTYGKVNGSWFSQSQLQENTWNLWAHDDGQGRTSESGTTLGQDTLIWCDEPAPNGESSLAYGVGDNSGNLITIVEWRNMLNMAPANPENLRENVRPNTPTSDFGDPINAINGNVFSDTMDIMVPCPGVALTFSHSYNSVLNYNGSLGPKWTHSLNWILEETNTVFNDVTNRWKIIQTGKGLQYAFLCNTNNTFNSPSENDWKLISTNNGYLLTDPGIAYYSFNSNGVLQSISDPWQNYITLTYTNAFPTHKLIRAEHSNGQFLSFTYGGYGLEKVSTPVTNFYVKFAYNSLGEMTNVTRHISEGKFSTVYTYDATTNHSLISKVNADGSSMSWSYETNSFGQFTSTGTVSRIQTNYYLAKADYNTNSLTTVTYTQRGTNVIYEYHYHPILKKITDIRGPDLGTNNWGIVGKGISYEYDLNGNMTKKQMYDYGIHQGFIVTKKYDAYHNVTNATSKLTNYSLNMNYECAKQSWCKQAG